MEELLEKVLEKAVEVATEPAHHVGYTRTTRGKAQTIRQKGSVIKEREQTEKPKKEELRQKPEEVLHGEEHQQFTKLLDSYFTTQEKISKMVKSIEDLKPQMESVMSEIRPMLAKFENLEKIEAKFRSEFKDGDWDYKFLSFSRESKPYKDLYVKAFNLLTDMQKGEMKSAEEALKKITAQEKFDRSKVEKALALMKSYLGKSMDEMGNFYIELSSLIKKAQIDDPGYERENEKEKQKAKSKIDDLKKRKKIVDKDKGGDKDKDDKNEKKELDKNPKKKKDDASKDSGKDKKKDKETKKEPKKDGTYQTGIKKQFIGSIGNLLSLRERAHKLMEEFFSRSKDKEKKPKNEKTAEKEEEKSKSLISAVVPLVMLKLNDVLEKSRTPGAKDKKPRRKSGRTQEEARKELGGEPQLISRHGGPIWRNMATGREIPALVPSVSYSRSPAGRMAACQIAQGKMREGSGYWGPNR